MKTYENATTGERIELPESIQPGWQHRPDKQVEVLRKIYAEKMLKLATSNDKPAEA
jgi:hypothetical protein